MLFADKVKKTNMFDWTQERTLAITNVAIYNVHKKECKRRIPLSDFGGITKTVHPSKANEFTVHVPSSYDYRFSSARRDEIVDLLKQLYLIQTKQNCPVFHTQAKDLKDFTTTEKDLKKGVSRFPSDDYRAYEEDLQKTGGPALHKQESTVEDQLNNFEANQKIRGA